MNIKTRSGDCDNRRWPVTDYDRCCLRNLTEGLLHGFILEGAGGR